MRSATRWLTIVCVCLAAMTPGVVRSDEHTHEHSKLPPGPIRDRHDLMKSMGQQAENINNAFNTGAEGFNIAVIQRSAQAIALSAHQIPGLFPKGSTDPHSRALPAIWENWDKFEDLTKQLEHEATSIANAADTGGDEKLPNKTKKMFAICKSCHDQFRRPEKKKGK